MMDLGAVNGPTKESGGGGRSSITEYLFMFPVLSRSVRQTVEVTTILSYWM